MNTRTELLKIPVTLAAFWLAACDNPITTPYELPAEVIPNTDATAAYAAATWFSGVAAQLQSSGSFQIELIPTDAGAQAYHTMLRAAAGPWMQVLGGTELPDVEFAEGPKPECLGLRLDAHSRVVDDLAVLVSVRNMDGLGGTLAIGGPCWVHWESSLPHLGALILDRTDVEELDARDLRHLIAHEIGHVLGVGALWGNFALLRNPSRHSPGVDTHFEGRLATAAFDAAGGTGYLHGKVPVENYMGPGSADVHWRESVLHSELMTPVLARGESHPLSAITIQSLADLGYTVDLSLAEDFTVPVPGGSTGVNEGDHDRALSLAGDVRVGPLLALDTERGVVRALRGLRPRP